MIQALKALGRKAGTLLSLESERSRQVVELLGKRVPRHAQATSRVNIEVDALRNCLFYGSETQRFAILGNQIVQVPKRSPHEVEYAANLVRVEVMRTHAKLMGIEGQFGVVPQNGSPLSRNLASISNSVWEHQRAETKFTSVKSDALLWAINTGSSFILNEWDPDKGDLERFYWFSENDDSVIDEMGMSPEDKQYRDQNGLFDDLAPGEVSARAFPLFQAYPDMASKGSLDDCRWFCIHQYLPRDLVAEIYGADEKDMAVEDATASTHRFEEALALMSSGSTRSAAYASYELEYKNRVWLTRCWERPSRANPRGKFMAVAGGRCLRDTENPYVADRSRKLHIPVVKWDYARMTGRFWGLSLTGALVQPQYRRNRSRSLQAMYEELYCKPGIMIPQNCGIAPNKTTNLPGPVYEYNPAMGEPKQYPIPVMPKEAQINASMCDAEIAQLGSQSNIDTSKQPGQMRSGAGINAMNADRDLALSHAMRNMLEAEQACGEQFLALGKLYYSTERVAMYRGPNGEFAARAFSASDLSNNVRILAEPGQLESSNDFRQTLSELVKGGLLNPATNPDDRQAVLKALRYKTTDELIDDMTQDEEMQEQEIREMVANWQTLQGYPTLPIDDDRAHMRVIKRERHSDEWKRYPEKLKALIMAHWSMHDAQLQAKRAQELAMIAATQSTPSAPGVASQPRRS